MSVPPAAPRSLMPDAVAAVMCGRSLPEDPNNAPNARTADGVR